MKERDILRFEVSSDQISLKQLLDQDFAIIEIKAISNAYPNRRQTHFTLESMEDGIPTFYNKPILGYFKNGDFESHNGQWRRDSEAGRDYWDTEFGERVLGVIRESDNIEIVEEKGQKWIKLTSVLFVQYVFPQIKRLFKDRKKKVSVEVDVLDSYIDKNGIQCINKFRLLGITILGSRRGVPVEEGIEGASLSVVNFMSQKEADLQTRAVFSAYEYLEQNNGVLSNHSEKKKNEGEQSMAENNQKLFNVDKSPEGVVSHFSILSHEQIDSLKEYENFEDAISSAFLEAGDGWKEDYSLLKYPVMGIENDKLVYSANALSLSKFYSNVSENEAMSEKVKQIFEELSCEDSSVQFEHYYKGLGSVEKFEKEKAELAEKNTQFEADLAKAEEAKVSFEAEMDEKIKNFENTIAEKTTEFESLKAKYEDYEAIKVQNEEFATAIKSYENNNIANQAVGLMAQFFEQTEIDQMRERCEKGEFATFELAKQEIALAVLEKQQANKKDKNHNKFEAPVVNPIEHPLADDKKTHSNWGRLKDYHGGKN